MVEFTTIIGFEILERFTDYTSVTKNVSQLAREIGRSHVTLLPHIDNLIKADVLSEEIRGRNKELSLVKDSIFCQKAMGMAEDYKLLKSEPLLLKIGTEIRGIIEPVIVFGSYAKGTFDQDSDVDILVIGRRTKKLDERFRHVSDITGKEVNVKYVDKIRKSDSLMQEVLKHHIVLNNACSFVRGVLHGQD